MASLSPDEYVTRHQAQVEEVLSRAVDEAFTLQVDDPLAFISRQISLSKEETGDCRESRWTARAWVSSLGVATPLVDALIPNRDTSDELRAMCELASLSCEELAAKLRAGDLAARFAAKLRPALIELARAGPAQDDDLGSKFAGAIEMSYAGLETFSSGLQGRIGEPQAAVFETMRQEHRKRADSSAEFTTGNYGITTTSCAEWLFVVEPTEGSLRQMGLERWGVELEAKLPDRSRCRQVEALERVLERCHAYNERLAQLDEPLLIEDEVIAARLYTGPLFVKYNAVLRGLHSENTFLRQQMVSLCCAPGVAASFSGGTLPWDSARAQSNKYVTTLHAINSCIVKAGKLTVCTKIYRGMSGMALPSQFWHANEFGVRGGVENAFMSTTTMRDVAMGYASGSSRAGIVFEIQQGMIDRGADVSWLSQYPHEREILFGPLTGIELQGTRVEGAVVVVEARLSVNLNALTIEQVRGSRMLPPPHANPHPCPLPVHPSPFVHRTHPHPRPSDMLALPRGQVISKMQRSHVGLLDSLLDKLRFAGAPDQCMQPLRTVRARSSVRGREVRSSTVVHASLPRAPRFPSLPLSWPQPIAASTFALSISASPLPLPQFFNQPSLFLEATKEALDAMTRSIEMVGEPSSWDALATAAADPQCDLTPEALAARLRSVAELLGNEEKDSRAAHLLTRAIEVCPSHPVAERVDKILKQELIILKGSQRAMLYALDYLVRFSGEEPLHEPWPRVTRQLAKALGDHMGTGVAYCELPTR